MVRPFSGQTIHWSDHSVVTTLTIQWSPPLYIKKDRIKRPMTRVRASRRLIEEAMPFYREGGEAVGELLSAHPEREPEIWALVAGTGIWKRYYLVAFRSIWRRENPQAYTNMKAKRHRDRKGARDRASKLHAAREAGKPLAMPTERRPRKDLGERQ